MPETTTLLNAYQELKLRDNQLKNIRVVVNSPLPKKKEQNFEKNVLPSYILRQFNAQQTFNKIYDKASNEEKLKVESLVSL